MPSPLPCDAFLGARTNTRNRRSIAHVNPTFVFDELVVTHYCGSIGGLSGLVVTAITQQAVAQGYKVVGSMELLGDPLSLVSKVRCVCFAVGCGKG